MMQQDNHIFQGMRRDNHPIRQESQFLWDAYNIRLTTRDGNTMLSLTNELGTEKVLDISDSFYIGHAIVDNWLVLFTKSMEDTVEGEGSICDIYRVDLRKLDDEDPTLKAEVLEESRLGFDEKHPIQTFVDIESEFIKKVYWTDGINRPRVINIAKPELLGVPSNTPGIYPESPFDFVQDLELNEKVTVNRVNSTNGTFPSGVIQYAFTYYYKYGQETNIFNTSELLYISHPDRGGSPEDRIPVGFEIKIENIDTRFQYLRIYSILRTSIDAVPTVKRIADIEINNNTTVKFIDIGTSGDIIDPTQLLYIGGKDITAGCIAAKEGTMFLGNITYKRRPITELLKESNKDGIEIQLSSSSREIKLDGDAIQGYIYQNQLSQNTSTFKSRDYYRLGIQFQHKSGEWSQPIFIKDDQITTRPSYEANEDGDYILELPTVIAYMEDINEVIPLADLKNAGYLKVRPLIAKPEYKDRDIIAQGILCPTVYNINNRFNNAPFSQSSWSFRPFLSFTDHDTAHDKVSAVGVQLPFKHLDYLKKNDSRNSEVQNITSDDNTKEVIDNSSKSILSDYEASFGIDQSILTFHSPDIEFDSTVQTLINQGNLKMRIVGVVEFNYSYGDIDIQASSAPLCSQFGKIRSASTKDSTGTRALASDLFYFDCTAKTSGNGSDTKVVPIDGSSHWWMTYLWHRSGSLNNDISRYDDSARSAELKKKIVSNIKISNHTHWENISSVGDIRVPLDFELDSSQVFNSNEVSLLRIPDSKIEDGYDTYYGNVDFLSVPSNNYNIISYFTSYDGSGKPIHTGLQPLKDGIKDSSEGVRIKYKSTPHAVLALKYADWCRRPLVRLDSDIYDNIQSEDPTLFWLLNKPENATYTPPQISSKGLFNLPNVPKSYLYLAELYRTIKPEERYGGYTNEALQNNLWIVAGESVKLEISNNNPVIEWIWGDTWYQRYDCLKTYPFTKEDENQMVEIGSFMCETRVNIDGRYDRNRGLISNLNVSPQNFNLINPVYSQLNTFFNYRIYDDDYYKSFNYPSQIIWTNNKNPGAILDSWTNLHLASSIDLDSTNGAVTAIVPWNDILIGFQESAVNQILYNSRVQIQASDGVPIEIANSQKVDGSRIYNDTIGCQDKFGLITTPMGVYFIDNNSTSIYKFDGSLHNLGVELGTLYWMRDNRCDYTWTPIHPDTRGHNGIRLYYDPKYSDIYFIPGPDRGPSVPGKGYRSIFRDALCYSEQLGQFTSIMSYGGAVMFSSDSNLYSLTYSKEGPYYHTHVWKNFSGKANNIFGSPRDFYFSFISNDAPTLTKIFDTLEMEVDRYVSNRVTPDGDKYTTTVQQGQPFNYIRVSNEYQDTGEVRFDASNLRKKFRIWRALIPREQGGRARIRNPWTKITLGFRQDLDNPDYSRIVMNNISVKYTV